MQSATYIVPRSQPQAVPTRVLRVVRQPGLSIEAFVRTRPQLEGTVRELARVYRAEEARTRRRTGSGLRTLDDVLDGHILPQIGDRRAADVGVDLVLAFIDLLAHQGFSGSSIRKVISTLSGLYDWAGREHAVVNPVRLLPRGALPSAAPRDRYRAQLEVLELGDVARILSADLPLQRRLLWTVLLLTGARFGEAAGLAWGDIALGVGPLAGELRIERSWDCKGHELGATKTGDVRRVPVIRQLADVLVEARADFERRYKREPNRNDVVCRFYAPRRGGEWRFWAETTAIRLWRRDLTALRIADPVSGTRRLHATRHTFVSQCLRLEAPERALQPVTHSTRSLESERSSAFSLYAHLDWAATCKAVVRLERALAEVM